jgi:hypothetical protein
MVCHSPVSSELAQRCESLRVICRLADRNRQGDGFSKPAEPCALSSSTYIDGGVRSRYRTKLRQNAPISLLAGKSIDKNAVPCCVVANRPVFIGTWLQSRTDNYAPDQGNSREFRRLNFRLCPDLSCAGRKQSRIQKPPFVQ